MRQNMKNWIKSKPTHLNHTDHISPSLPSPPFRIQHCRALWNLWPCSHGSMFQKTFHMQPHFNSNLISFIFAPCFSRRNHNGWWARDGSRANPFDLCRRISHSGLPNLSHCVPLTNLFLPRL